MESRASSHSSSRRMSTGTVPLMEGGMDGYGAPQPMTMTWTRNGASVRVSANYPEYLIVQSKYSQSSTLEVHCEIFGSI